MNKILILTFCFLAALTPMKKANAGLLLAWNCDFEAEGVKNGLTCAGAVYGIAVGVVGIPLALMKMVPNDFLNVSIAMLVLDAKANVKTQELNNQLANHYSFIDNQNIINDLTKTIQAKYDGKSLVTLNEAETRSLLAPADLTED